MCRGCAAVSDRDIGTLLRAARRKGYHGCGCERVARQGVRNRTKRTDRKPRLDASVPDAPTQNFAECRVSTAPYEARRTPAERHARSGHSRRKIANAALIDEASVKASKRDQRRLAYQQVAIIELRQPIA